MSGSLPEMEGGWDEPFDESYLVTYVPFMDEERTRAEAFGAVALAGLEPGADVLDTPCATPRRSGWRGRASPAFAEVEAYSGLECESA